MELGCPAAALREMPACDVPAPLADEQRQVQRTVDDDVGVPLHRLRPRRREVDCVRVEGHCRIAEQVGGRLAQVCGRNEAWQG